MTVASQGDAPAPEEPTELPAEPPEETGEQEEPQAFKLRGGSFTLLVLQLIDLKNPDFFQWLLDKIAQAPNFYRHAPVVLDLEGRIVRFNQACERMTGYSSQEVTGKLF